MQMRTILLGAFQESGKGIGDTLSIDFLKAQITRRDITAEDFDHELTAALHAGDFLVASPGMIGITEAGLQHYAATLTIK